MEKQKQTLETEKKQSVSDLEKQTKGTERLETEKNLLQFQIQEEKRILQQVSGNLY